MSTFEGYARYYDLLYRDKDYSRESSYVLSFMGQYASQAKTVLELGCGTGGHAESLVKQGFVVHGIDRSREMLERAQQRKAAMGSVKEDFTFSCGDVRKVRMQNKYDVVLSLFHVVSYQTTNADLQAMFNTARDHLSEGGLFIFDCWYGPGVLTTLPEYREKHFVDEDVDILRVCEPEMQPNRNCVNVKYRILITDKKTAMTQELIETHTMRYLFLPEIEGFANSSKMKLVFARDWLGENSPGLETWNACFGLIAC